MDKVIIIASILVAVGGAFYLGRIYERAWRQAELTKSLARLKARKNFDRRS